ncbi:dethiobiotin synthetase [Pseudidiomarina planktonica]|uniref:ATP-dependent dethiobiotin synthetase BioD n=1 Tax=Pseudidiomarina planktonica TaxID=1323738 RepID=A0A1Y6EZ43_9GAMM|nr:dethiobiotin synthase [Pseudidiomarina planktonica]RUO65315.1 dethiobiotin synthase [Pseudidiomarina planktonica]SMQ65523.1 dethiobiotin synthetase [Pseudidiomarina planktonica]
MKTYFITGTDTDAGKTVAAVALLQAFAKTGLRTCAMKPIAAGCEQHSEGLRNSDALLLQAAASVPMTYQQVNPIALVEPIAPHIAAAIAGKPIQVADLVAAWSALQQLPADLLLVEGAGGWELPLSANQTMPEFVKQTADGVILVVGLKLGCLNHAMLTVQAIRAAGVPLVGWVGNQCLPQKMPYQAENIDYLRAKIDAPWLGTLPYSQSSDRLELADHLQLNMNLSEFS